MKKKLMVLVLGIAMVFALAACGSSEPEAPAEDETKLAEVTTDKDAKSVTINAVVNGDVFGKSTMHFVVNKDGKAGKDAMLQAYTQPEDVYNALVEVGGEPWNTTTDKIESGEYTDGQKVDVTLTWEGQDEPVAQADVIKSDEGAFKTDVRFSGNLDNQKEVGSGCISCLNSCWAGITTNASYAFDDIDKGIVTAYPNEEVLPEAGTVVQVTFTLK